MKIFVSLVLLFVQKVHSDALLPGVVSHIENWSRDRCDANIECVDASSPTTARSLPHDPKQIPFL